MLLLVDGQDRFLGKYEEKERCHLGKGLHHRAFVVLVYNKLGEVLLQKRKHIRFDNYWDLTAISHVLHLIDHDETYEEAAHRSLKIEMGIGKISLKNKGGFNYYAKYKNQCENEYCSVLVGRYNGVIHPNNEVMYSYRWMPEEEFAEDIKKNKNSYTPWAIQSMPFLTKP